VLVRWLYRWGDVVKRTVNTRIVQRGYEVICRDDSTPA